MQLPWNKSRQYFTKGEVIGAALIAALFVAALFVSQYYKETIEDIVFLDGPFGMLLYVGLTILSVVLAPMAALPFLPIAVSLWGSLATALLSISGWSIGAIIAFVLARRFGRPFVAKFMSIERAEKIAKRITGAHAFWLVLVSRIILPTDIVSYAIGLFVPIRPLPYTVATIVGVSPLAFALAYGAALPPTLQALIFGGTVGMVIVFTLIVVFRAHQIDPKNKRRR